MRASRQRATTSAPSIRQHERRYSSASTLCGIPRPEAEAPDLGGMLLFSSAILGSAVNPLERAALGDRWGRPGDYLRASTFLFFCSAAAFSSADGSIGF